ncbi:MAG TPA: hypothetical protein IAC85_03270 [Candidatus Faecenecus gallistercoris]|uniref:HD domain-containing protein n=1 Tax=Candidatus Faecenecus gallistercoris TaxID=2840793 RepID=A0A9D0YZ57_9FIRM|nr:hypothetical protein [Bacillota bacterium]MDD7102622.1 hypothetical protein [Bacillota bacterium]MDY4050471.1 hypothetical protein [Candidatus Faecenecus gallistercoris]CDE08499.1 putative uncharacterized protein [Bacillus sp. CAG:988]HIQ64739.1 hypothetical protein [Candidatus Faecenecus gallistercoris]
MDKIKCFEKEMSYIQNPDYLVDFQYLVSNLPDYFFEIPASSTGKYHPRYALGTGGLLRHTKAAVRIAYELLADPVIGDKYTSDEKDLMLIALCLHDGLKSGKDHSKYTQFDHPLLMANWIEEEKEHLHFNDEEIAFLQSVIASHMGCWTKDYDGNEVLPKPKTKYQNFVHMCDYLASRKCILLEFDENNNVIG